MASVEGTMHASGSGAGDESESKRRRTDVKIEQPDPAPAFRPFKVVITDVYLDIEEVMVTEHLVRCVIENMGLSHRNSPKPADPRETTTERFLQACTHRFTKHQVDGTMDHKYAFCNRSACGCKELHPSHRRIWLELLGNPQCIWRHPSVDKVASEEALEYATLLFNYDVLPGVHKTKKFLGKFFSEGWLKFDKPLGTTGFIKHLPPGQPPMNQPPPLNQPPPMNLAAVVNGMINLTTPDIHQLLFMIGGELLNRDQ